MFFSGKIFDDIDFDDITARSDQHFLSRIVKLSRFATKGKALYF
jgi:hypothetical protein